MIVAQIISGILGNYFIVLFAVAIFTTISKLRRYRLARKPVNGAYVFWGEVLFYNVGIGFIYGGIFQAYLQAYVAPTIGWQPSPFEYELGWMQIPLGLVAVLAMWRGFEFRLASTIVAAVFLLAAAAQHVNQILCCRNYAPNNAGLILWFGDIFVPVVLLIAAALSRGGES